MTVYIDGLFEATPENAQAKRHGTRWCHMIADSDEELHAFADRLGLKRAWFQQRANQPWQNHYDLVPSKRLLAVRLGAKEIDSHEFGNMLIVRRKAYFANKEETT